MEKTKAKFSGWLAPARAFPGTSARSVMVLLSCVLLSTVPSLASSLPGGESGSIAATTEETGPAEPSVCAMHRYWGRAGSQLQQSEQLSERLLAQQFLSIQRSLDPACQKQASVKVDGTTRQRLLAEAMSSRNPVDLALAVPMALGTGDEAQSRALASRWTELEPGNLAPLVLTRAPIDVLLAATASRDHYSDHGYAQVRAYFNALRQVPRSGDEISGGQGEALPGPEAEAAMAAWSLRSAVGLPAYQSIVEPCKGQALQASATRREECLQLGRTLALRSQGLLDSSIGIAIIGNAADTPGDAQLAADLRRTADWQRQRWLEVLATMGEAAQTAHAIRLLETPEIQSEIQVMHATLREHGIPLRPPAGWSLPPRPGLPAAQ